ncbi:MAG TPA: ATPase, T2SS/T4P/T4SS family [Candidatus Limnocylindrales bacterium]|nr:ATPase, T2SS/T4P/T4SS family [Candidatus Limnocylindrales bacterium]
MPAEGPARVSTTGVDLREFVRTQLTMTADPEIASPFSEHPDRNRILLSAIRDAVALNGDYEPTDDLVRGLFDDLVGLGPLQRLMDDPRVTDILVNRFDEVYVERHGRLELTEVAFRDRRHLEQTIHKIVALVDREISVDKPLVDARMADGSRANAVFAPVGGPTLCIRKFGRIRLGLRPVDGLPERPTWVSAGGLSPSMAAFLEAAVLGRANILIAGATGSGKSTLLRSLISVFPPDERIITIEDTAELELDNPHWVKLECVHSRELAGKGTQDRRLDVADLVQNALRMRPDRLIVGEIRHSKEAYHVLESLNTGHDGSATTIHASSCADSLARLELLIGRDFGQLQPAEIRRYIARVFDLIIFIARLRDGRRCVLEIVELRGVDDRGHYQLTPVFQTEIRSTGTATLVRFGPMLQTSLGPRLEDKLRRQGIAWTS